MGGPSCLASAAACRTRIDGRDGGFSLRRRYPNRIPVVCLGAVPSSDNAPVKKCKMLLPSSWTVEQFRKEISERMPGAPVEQVRLGGCLVEDGDLLSELDKHLRDADGCLYAQFGNPSGCSAGGRRVQGRPQHCNHQARLQEDEDERHAKQRYAGGWQEQVCGEDESGQLCASELPGRSSQHQEREAELQELVHAKQRPADGLQDLLGSQDDFEGQDRQYHEWAAEMQDMVHAKERQVDDLQEQPRSKDELDGQSHHHQERAAELQEQLCSERQRVAGLQGQLSAKEEQLRSEEERSRLISSELEGQNRRRQEEAAELRDRLLLERQRAAGIQELLGANEERAAELQDQLASERRRVTGLQEVLRANEQQMRGQEQEDRQRASELEAQIAQHSGRVSELHERLQRSQAITSEFELQRRDKKPKGLLRTVGRALLRPFSAPVPGAGRCVAPLPSWMASLRGCVTWVTPVWSPGLCAPGNTLLLDGRQVVKTEAVDAHRCVSTETGRKAPGKYLLAFAIENSAGPDPRVKFGVRTRHFIYATEGAYLGSTSQGWAYCSSDGRAYHDGQSVGYGEAAKAGDVIGMLLDLDNGTLSFFKNEHMMGIAHKLPTSGEYFPCLSTFKFGDRVVALSCDASGSSSASWSQAGLGPCKRRRVSASSPV